MRARVAAVGAGATVLEAAGGTWGLAVLGPDRIALFLVACAAATALVTVVLWHFLGRPPAGTDGGPGPGGRPPGGDPPPPWWPEFERDFRRHVRSQRSPV